jgi:cytidine deaminase
MIPLQNLVDRALKARERAYCPYSQFRVGAAVLTESGQIFDGANVENASYGLSMCAERVAIQSAVAAGARVIVAMAIATETGASPCGACRQVAQEFAKGLRVFLVTSSGEHQETDLETLLPFPFAKSQLSVQVD